MSDWRDVIPDPSIEDLSDQTQESAPSTQVQHPALEALAQPLMRLQDFLHSGDDNKNLGSLHGQYVKMTDMLGIGSLGNTLHRFALGDNLKHTPGSGDDAALDMLGALPLGLEGANFAKSGLRAALEGSVRADGKTALGMFTGQHAATSDLGALSQAKVMAASGKTPEEIHSITGWFKGKDGQWRQEIDDSTSQWNAGAYRRNIRQDDLQNLTHVRGAEEIKKDAQETGQSVSSIISQYERQGIDVHPAVKALAHNEDLDRLGHMRDEYSAKYNAPMDAKLQDVFQHDDLYAAYPHLKDMPVHFNDLGPYLAGSIDTEAGRMKLNSRNGYGIDGHDTVLHELQHAVQKREGFDPGDSEGRILENDYEKARGHAQFEDTLQAAIDIRNGNGLFREINPDAAELADDKSVTLEQIEDHLHFMQKNRPTRITPVKAREMYNAAGGEVEARATEKRKTMNRATRKQSYPMESYDTPQDQILLRNQR